jgi:uncharacterized DUF497 family protein
MFGLPATLESVGGFDWDAGNTEKCSRHGLSTEEVESLFRSRIDVFPDIGHSDAETRYFDIGRSSSGRHVFVAFTLWMKRGSRRIRPISARFMHAKEINHYAAEIARHKN